MFAKIVLPNSQGWMDEDHGSEVIIIDGYKSRHGLNRAVDRLQFRLIRKYRYYFVRMHFGADERDLVYIAMMPQDGRQCFEPMFIK